jgi:uridine kinase
MAYPDVEDAVTAIRLAKPPAGMTVRVIAVDGPGGAGKTTFAEQLGRALEAPVIHTDDFADWDKPIEWGPALIDEVLRPLKLGMRVRFKPSSWGGPDRPEVLIEPADYVILEGVTASREAFRPYLAYSIWIDAPRELRLRRGLERDGVEARAKWEAWMAEEDRYIETEHPADRVDLVILANADFA